MTQKLLFRIQNSSSLPRGEITKLCGPRWIRMVTTKALMWRCLLTVSTVLPTQSFVQSGFKPGQIGPWTCMRSATRTGICSIFNLIHVARSYIHWDSFYIHPLIARWFEFIVFKLLIFCGSRQIQSGGRPFWPAKALMAEGTRHALKRLFSGPPSAETARRGPRQAQIEGQPFELGFPHWRGQAQEHVKL